MKHVQIHPEGGALDYKMAAALAASFAASDPDLEKPVVVAWHDKRMGTMSPAIAGADVNTRWRDYGESHCGCLDVDVDGEYDFVFADAAAFQDYGPSPYANLVDAEGQEYICQINALRDPHRPDKDACVALDEYTSKLT